METGDELMGDTQRKKFKKFIYYCLLFMAIGIDMTLKICYSFSFLVLVFGDIFLLERVNYRKLSKFFIILTIGMGPFVVGIFIFMIKYFI